MPGPVPKPKDERRRRNAPVHEWVILSEPRRGRAPALEGRNWTDQTKDWWKAIWKTPMATQWQKGDIPSLMDLARIKQAFWNGEYKLASEIRQREDRFGLTPKGRRDLRWIITEEDADRAGMDLPGDQPIASVRRLRAVDPEADKPKRKKPARKKPKR